MMNRESLSPVDPDRVVVSRRYQILRRLGAGATGAVYLARDGARDRRVALKIIQCDRSESEGLARLQAEFRSVASLHHGQIADAYDFGFTERDGLPFYTREYIEGEPLAAGPPSSDDDPLVFLRPILDIIAATRYLHVHDVFDLDLHPGNLIVSKSQDRGCVLIDIGFGAGPGSRSSSPRLADFRTAAGRVGEAASPQSDIFSIGSLLAARLTGSYEEVTSPYEIADWDPRLLLSLERIVCKATQRDPARRFRSVAEFHDALSKCLGAGSQEIPSEPRDMTLGREQALDEVEAVLRRVARGDFSVQGLMNSFKLRQ